jgi:predicted 2-oxoglutarate/Fe(II)-dependent dioxygenase YbiX
MGETRDTTYPVFMDGNWIEVGCKMTSNKLNWTEDINWFFVKLSKWINSLNLGINLVNTPHTVFRKYEIGDFFIKHMDDPINSNNHVDENINLKLRRYMTVCVQLSDETEYDGGDVFIYRDEKKELVSKKIGHTYTFGIKVPHEVTTIIKGNRKSLIIFINESHVKRINLL